MRKYRIFFGEISKLLRTKPDFAAGTALGWRARFLTPLREGVFTPRLFPFFGGTVGVRGNEGAANFFSSKNR